MAFCFLLKKKEPKERTHDQTTQSGNSPLPKLEHTFLLEDPKGAVEGVAVLLLGVDGLHTGFYHAGYFIMLIVSFVGFYWGREEGKREGEDGKRVKLWTYSNGMVESISNPNSVMSIYLSRSFIRFRPLPLNLELTNSDNTSSRTDPKSHPSRHIFPWHCAPLSELLQSRVGRESDGRVGALSEHLFFFFFEQYFIFLSIIQIVSPMTMTMTMNWCKK